LADSDGSDAEYDFPELCEHSSMLVSLLSEIGEAKVDNSGIKEISWQDLKAWLDITGIELTLYEIESMKRLSSIYVSQYYQSTDKSCLAPNVEKPKDRDVIASKMKNLIAMLRGS
jgi:hypothetical protein